MISSWMPKLLLQIMQVIKFTKEKNNLFAKTTTYGQNV
jgi:hypothetical protein